MDQNTQNSEGIIIDLSQYTRVVIKRKKTLIAVILLAFVTGVAIILFSPKIYRASMMIQPPVVGSSLTGANDLETAENLKNLIINGAYNDELIKISDIDSEINNLDFKVVIPDKTNILNISVILEERKKEFGVGLLQGLTKAITNSFAKIIEVKINDILNQIESNKRAIVIAKAKAENIQKQIKEISFREDRLLEELKSANTYATQIWEKRDLYLKESASLGVSPAIFFASYLQSNSNYLNQLNNQLSDLSIRRGSLDLELKNIEVQVSNLQTEIGRLNTNEVFISNLKIIAQPKLFPNPIALGKKKILAVSIFIGLFFGMLVVFLQEFWVNNLARKQ